jgi:hypothetical protein
MKFIKKDFLYLYILCVLDPRFKPKRNPQQQQAGYTMMRTMSSPITTSRTTSTTAAAASSKKKTPLRGSTATIDKRILRLRAMRKRHAAYMERPLKKLVALAEECLELQRTMLAKAGRIAARDDQFYVDGPSVAVRLADLGSIEEEEREEEEEGAIGGFEALFDSTTAMYKQVCAIAGYSDNESDDDTDPKRSATLMAAASSPSPHLLRKESAERARLLSLVHYDSSDGYDSSEDNCSSSEEDDENKTETETDEDA